MSKEQTSTIYVDDIEFKLKHDNRNYHRHRIIVYYEQEVGDVWVDRGVGNLLEIMLNRQAIRYYWSTPSHMGRETCHDKALRKLCRRLVKDHRERKELSAAKDLLLEVTHLKAQEELK